MRCKSSLAVMYAEITKALALFIHSFRPRGLCSPSAVCHNGVLVVHIIVARKSNGPSRFLLIRLRWTVDQTYAAHGVQVSRTGALARVTMAQWVHKEDFWLELNFKNRHSCQERTKDG